MLRGIEDPAFKTNTTARNLSRITVNDIGILRKNIGMYRQPVRTCTLVRTVPWVLQPRSSAHYFQLSSELDLTNSGHSSILVEMKRKTVVQRRNRLRLRH